MNKPTSAILLISDLHIGAKFRLPGNSYSIKIAQDRLDRYTSQALEFLTFWDIKNAAILFLGDNVQNELIRPGSSFEIECNVMEQVDYAGRMIAKSIRTIQDEGIHVKSWGCFGNHARATRRSGDSSPQASYDLQAYNLANAILGDDNPAVITPEVYGYCQFRWDTVNVVALHGHTVRSVQGVPVNGIQRLRGNLNACGNNPDLLVMGHFHTWNVLTHNNQHAVVNGTLVGPDPYAHSLGLANSPSQGMLLVGKGGVISAQEIRL